MEYLTLKERFEFALTCKKNYNDHFIRIVRARRKGLHLEGYSKCNCGLLYCSHCDDNVYCDYAECFNDVCEKCAITCNHCNEKFCKYEKFYKCEMNHFYCRSCAFKIIMECDLCRKEIKKCNT